jgi:hypothetical protein
MGGETINLQLVQEGRVDLDLPGQTLVENVMLNETTAESGDLFLKECLSI